MFQHGTFPRPEEVHDLDTEKLRSIGFAKAKAGYVKGIARAALDGIVPGRNLIERRADDEIVDRLTQIRGIGRWSVEMFLIFGLGRPDVLPIHDYGIRQGFAIVYRKRKLPEPEHILEHGEHWRPHRTTASWYLWRAADMANEKNVTIDF